MIYGIKIWPDSILARRASPVAQADIGSAKTAALLENMVETMQAANGVGLSGPQVGLDARLVVLKVVQSTGEPLVVKLVNPEVVERSAARVASTEGCLSLPGFRDRFSRHARVVVSAFDEAGARVELGGEGLLSVALQHELDHLDGHTIADLVSPLKRTLLRTKYVKAKKRGLRYAFPPTA